LILPLPDAAMYGRGSASDAAGEALSTTVNAVACYSADKTELLEG
jgi:hypothetical protein